MTEPHRSHSYSRRHFLRQLLGAGALTVAGLDPLFAQNPSSPSAGAFRFAFLTDLHLMKGGDLRSAQGIAACLTTVEKLTPRPDFILVGGDLVHRARDLTIAEAEKRLDFFLQIWRDHTALPAHWTFGNHDLVASSNLSVPPGGRHYGKGLFEDRFHLPHLYYSFDHKGWHFVILDNIALMPDRSYTGQLSDADLQFLQADLDAHRDSPTVICGHIPFLSNLPVSLNLIKAADPKSPNPPNLVCANSGMLFDDLPRHNVRAVLSGHLHHYEKLDMNGIPIINSGAVCGSYWKGPMYGCPEGYGVVDVGGNGSFAFDYRNYGWKAA